MNPVFLILDDGRYREWLLVEVDTERRRMDIVATRPADLDADGRYRDWTGVCAWLRDALGRRVGAQPMHPRVWRVVDHQ